MIFQHNGAPLYWGIKVRQFLNEKFPDRWIGRNGSVSGPPLFSRHYTVGFFLWVYIKDMVCRISVCDINDLEHPIAEATTTVTVEMSRRQWCEIKKYLDILHVNDDAYVEVY